MLVLQQMNTMGHLVDNLFIYLKKLFFIVNTQVFWVLAPATLIAFVFSEEQ